MKISRWIVMMVAVVTAILFQSAVSAAPTLNTSIHPESGTFRLHGMLPDEGIQMVQILIFDPQGDVEYVGQVMSREDGYFRHSYTMHNVKRGLYQVNITGVSLTGETPVSRQTVEMDAFPRGRSSGGEQTNEQTIWKTFVIPPSREIDAHEMLTMIAEYLATVHRQLQVTTERAEIRQSVEQAQLATGSAALLLERLPVWNSPVLQSVEQVMEQANDILLIARENETMALSALRLENSLLRLAEKAVEQAGVQTVNYVPTEQISSTSVIVRLGVENFIGKAESVMARFGNIAPLLEPAGIAEKVRKRIVLETPAAWLDGRTLQIEWSDELLAQWIGQGIHGLEIRSEYADVHIPLDVVTRQPGEGLVVVMGHEMDSLSYALQFDVQTIDMQGEFQSTERYNYPVRVDLKNVVPSQAEKEATTSEIFSIRRQNLQGQGETYVAKHYDQTLARLSFSTLDSGRFTVTHAVNPYADLTDVPWAEAAIVSLVANGFMREAIVEFHPQAAITSRDMIQWLSSVLNTADVDRTKRFQPTTLAEMAGQEWMTRQELAIMVSQALQMMKLSLPKSDDILTEFVDEERIDSLARQQVAQTIIYEIIQGHPGRMMEPDQMATRAEAAATLERLWNLMASIRQ